MESQAPHGLLINGILLVNTMIPSSFTLLLVAQCVIYFLFILSNQLNKNVDPCEDLILFFWYHSVITCWRISFLLISDSSKPSTGTIL